MSIENAPYGYYRGRPRLRNTKVSIVPREDVTADMVRERLAYDHNIGLLSWKIKPSNATPVGTVAGNKNKNGYINIKLFGRPYMAHRLAWLITHGEWPSDQIDHIDGDKCNNRLSNLREATGSQNEHNKPAFGYHYSAKGRCFIAAIRLGGEKVYLGSYRTAEEANAVYLATHAKHYGEYSFTQRPAGERTPEYASHPSAPSSPGARR